MLFNGEAPNLAGTDMGVNDPTLFLPNLEHVIVAQFILDNNKPPNQKELETLRERVARSYVSTLNELQQSMNVQHR